MGSPGEARDRERAPRATHRLWHWGTRGGVSLSDRPVIPASVHYGEKAVSVAGQVGRLNDLTLKGNEESPAEHGDSRRTAGLARLARLALAEQRAQPGCGTGG